MNYLYGAAVQGIQKFIFQTNELKDIVGASELVENICTSLFEDALRKADPQARPLSDNADAIINAAGNIKYIFRDKSVCEKIVRTFPREVLCYAPGITISQAVVELDDDDNFASKVDILEKKLRTQRNKPMDSTTLGLMGILRSRKTGLPVVRTETVKGTLEYLDAATTAKRYEERDGQKKRRNVMKLPRIAFGEDTLKHENVALNIEDMTGSNDWVAIIHADGNGLGQVVQKIGKDRNSFKKFSIELDEATKKSAVEAYHELVKNGLINPNGIIPIRPIVLGGDDFTVVCRADLAIRYVEYFIRNFEKNTESELLDGIFMHGAKHLTACAGLAYIKSSFPFYYGYNLAEALCSRAKKDAKRELREENGKMELPQSCLMFHKIQDSFVVDFEDIASRELTPQHNISFEFGPYYISKTPNRWTVDNLMSYVGLINGSGLKDPKKANAVKSNLRNWLSLLHENPGMADQKLFRLKELIDTSNDDDQRLLNFVNNVTDKASDGFVTPAYDILAINTINNQMTK